MFRDFLQRHVTAIDIVASILIVVLVMGNVFFVLQNRALQAELANNQQALATAHTNAQVVNFMQMFIDQVLRAQGEISFETRLNLESAVRALQDETILQHWQAFTSAKTEPEAQTAVKELLAVLVNKIKS